MRSIDKLIYYNIIEPSNIEIIIRLYLVSRLDSFPKLWLQLYISLPKKRVIQKLFWSSITLLITLVFWTSSDVRRSERQI